MKLTLILLLTALIAYAVNALLLPKSGADHGLGDC
jgi:hypothetical protein